MAPLRRFVVSLDEPPETRWRAVLRAFKPKILKILASSEELQVYDSLGPNENYASEFDRLAGLCRDLVDEYLVSSVLRPLQEAISLR